MTQPHLQSGSAVGKTEEAHFRNTFLRWWESDFSSSEFNLEYVEFFRIQFHKNGPECKMYPVAGVLLPSFRFVEHSLFQKTVDEAARKYRHDSRNGWWPLRTAYEVCILAQTWMPAEPICSYCQIGLTKWKPTPECYGFVDDLVCRKLRLQLTHGVKTCCPHCLLKRREAYEGLRRAALELATVKKYLWQCRKGYTPVRAPNEVVKQPPIQPSTFV